MPLYEYRCPTCRSTFELLRPMRTASADATCPKGHAGAERVVSLIAAQPRADSGLSSGGGCACGGAGCGCRR
jgi:putative FmdB family regulatory protein